MAPWLRFLVFALAIALRAETPAEIFVQTGHDHEVSAVAISADGRLALSGGWDRTMVLWDLASGREIRSFQGHQHIVGSVAFLPDGRRALSGSLDKTLKLWDLETGQVLRILTSRKNPVGDMAVSPDGQRVLAVDNDVLQMWDLGTGKALRTFKDSGGGHKRVSRVVWSRDGLRAVSATEEGRVQVWDAASGRLVQAFQGDTQDVYALALSADGTRVLLGGPSKVVKVWDLAGPRELLTLAGHTGEITGAAFCPDGTFLSASADRTLKLWDASGREMRTFTGHRARISALALAPDGRTALSGGEDITLRRWDLATGREIATLGSRAASVVAVAWAPDGRTALSSGYGRLRQWDMATGRLVRTLDADPSRARGLAISPDGHLALSGGDDHAVRLWDLGTGKLLRTLTADILEVESVAFSPDGRRAAAGSAGGYATLWDLGTGAVVRSLYHGSAVNPVLAFSPDGTRLLTHGEGNRMILWNLADGTKVRTFEGSKDALTTVGFSPDGKVALSAGWDHAIRLWDVATGHLLKTLEGHTDWVFAAAFSPSGGEVLSAGFDATVRRWDPATGKELAVLRSPMGMQNSLAWSPDGRRALTGGWSGCATVWDLAGGREEARLIGFNNGEWIAFTPEAYFEASSHGADQLNVRSGLRVYAVDQFFAKFYRPEVVAGALAGLAPPPGPALGMVLTTRRAPTVRILAPMPGLATGETQAKVELAITDEGGGIGDVRVYLNGTQVANDTRGVAVVGGPDGARHLVFTVSLAPGTNLVKAVATNGDGSMESVPAQVALLCRAEAGRPALHALVVGIDTYRNTSITLRNAVADAQGFAETLRASAAPLFSGVDVKVLTSPAETTKDALAAAFRELRPRVRPEDLFVFYDASHGVVDVAEDGEQYFLLTSNVALLSSRHIAADALSQRDLAALIGTIPALKKLVILDTCNAGKGGKEIQAALLQQTRGLTDATAVKVLQRAIGSAVFASSSDVQQALEGYRGHGLFTYVLMEGLRGKADLKKDGFITVLGLADYVEEEVLALSESVFKRQQTPVIQTGANFPIGKAGDRP